MKVLIFYTLSLSLVAVSGFWDFGTTTKGPIKGLEPFGRGSYTITVTPEHKGLLKDTVDFSPEAIRQSFFRWQEVQPLWRRWFFWGWDFNWLENNRRLNVVCGLSHLFVCIGTGTILNRRTVLTSCNLLQEYMDLQRELRIWALGTRGEYYTPFRYRVWRVTRLIPRSLNPEHLHGVRGTYSPRHDVCVIHSLDQMMTLAYLSKRGHYPFRSWLFEKTAQLTDDIWYTGSGYSSMRHMRSNYRIYIDNIDRKYVTDCSKFMPKYWGKFICIINYKNHVGIQNGGGFHVVDHPYKSDYIAGLGCFEIRYNEERVFAFTDLRYYHDLIEKYAYIRPGEYYEYAYPHWGMHYGILWNSVWANSPRIPLWQVQRDLYPLG